MLQTIHESFPVYRICLWRTGPSKKSKAVDRDSGERPAANPYGSYLPYGFFLPRSPELSKNLKRSGETAASRRSQTVCYFGDIRYFSASQSGVYLKRSTETAASRRPQTVCYCSGRRYFSSSLPGEKSKAGMSPQFEPTSPICGLFTSPNSLKQTVYGCFCFGTDYTVRVISTKFSEHKSEKFTI